MSRKRVAILGCTGSVGRQALAIAQEHRDRFDIVALQAHSGGARLVEQAKAFAPASTCLTGSPDRPAGLPKDIGFHVGSEGLLAMLDEASPDLVLNAITGAAGLPASEWTLQRGLSLALANKESLVIAGSYLMDLARRSGATILPVDSEHCAIHQCIAGNRRTDVRRVLLTGSGGPFRQRPLETFGDITPEEALQHPTWNMGPRITVGSATMMNKAFEVLEAHWLFDLRPDQIEVVIHPQSIVHSMVEFVDGSILAQCGVPDMRVPILYCLGWPERLPFDFQGFDPVRWRNLEFQPLESDRFPAVPLAFDVLERGGDSGAVLNAADEELTRLFLSGAVPFRSITAITRAVVQGRDTRPVHSLADVESADNDGRRAAQAAAARIPHSTTSRAAPE